MPQELEEFFLESQLGRLEQMDLTGSFRRELELLSEYAQAEGIPLLPYLKSDLHLFRALPEDKQRAVFQSLSCYRKIMSALKEKGEDLSFNLNSVWLALRTLDWRWHQDLFKNVRPHLIIEKLKNRPSNITTPRFLSLLWDSNHRQVGYVHVFRAEIPFS